MGPVEGGARQFSLTIEAESEPIAGSLGLPDGQALAFEGYVQLVAALEQVRQGPSSEDAPSWGSGTDPIKEG